MRVEMHEKAAADARAMSALYNHGTNWDPTKMKVKKTREPVFVRASVHLSDYIQAEEHGKVDAVASGGRSQEPKPNKNQSRKQRRRMLKKYRMLEEHISE